MEISSADPYDEARLRELWEVGKASDEHGRPWATYIPWEATRVAYLPNEAFDQRYHVAYEGAAMVGTARCALPRLDNTDSAHLELHVRPDHRRRGVGTALLERVLADLACQRRSVVMVEVSTPSGGEPSPGARFAEHHGFTVGIVDDHRVLDLAGTRDRWADLAAECAPHHHAYRLVTWHDEVPAEYVEGYCALQEAFNLEAPAGDLVIEPERWDAKRVRDKEERFRLAGRHEVVTAAVAPDGSVAGLSEIMVSDHAPDHGMQGGTLVLRGHRGHRLGLALKVVNQRAVVQRFPRCTRIHTWNAGVNDHMNAINDRLGFETVERLLELQRKLP